MYKKINRTASLAIISILMSTGSYAETVLDSAVLSDIKKDSKNPGKTELGKNDVENRLGNAFDLNTIFKFLTNIQFFNDDSLSTSDAKSKYVIPKHLDKRPAEISISGGKGYDNNFVIDGVGGSSKLKGYSRTVDNSNTSDGLATGASGVAGFSISEAVRSPQRIWVDKRIVDKVTVYDSNVPVEFSDFQGGVVDVKLRKATHKKEGSAFVAYSGSNLNQYTIHKEDTSSSATIPTRPSFKNYDYGIDYNYPISSRANMYVGYAVSDTKDTKTTSNKVLTKTYKNTSRLDKYSVLLNSVKGADKEWSINIMHHDYLYKQYINNGDYPDFSDNKNKALQLGATVKRKIKGGDLSVSVAQVNNKMAKNYDKNNWYIWEHSTANPNFTNKLCTGLKANGDLCTVGGAGKYAEEQTAQSVKVSYSKPYGDSLITWGTKIVRNVLEKNRDKTHYKYMSYSDTDYHPTHGRLTQDDGTLGSNTDQDLSGINNINKAMYIGDKVRCSDDAKAGGYCKDSQQALYLREVYSNVPKKMSYIDLGGYVQIEKNILEGNFTGGLRFDVDKGTGNNPISPRLSYTTNRNNINWTFGLNRYHSLYNGSLAMANFYGYRTEYLRPDRVGSDGTTYYGTDWRDDDSTATPTNSYDVRGLKNPRTDEFSVGMETGTIKTGMFVAKGIIRRSRDELVTLPVLNAKTYNYEYFLTNSGKSDYESLSLEYVKSYENSVFSIGTTFSKLDTNNATLVQGIIKKSAFENVLVSGETDEIVKQNALDIQRRIFNKPHVVNFSVISSWSDNLVTTLTGKYTPNYMAIIKQPNNKKHSDGKWYKHYKKNKISDHIVIDFNTKYKLPERMVGNKDIHMTFTIGNLLAKPVPRGNNAKKSNYVTTDRTVSIGLTYKF